VSPDCRGEEEACNSFFKRGSQMATGGYGDGGALPPSISFGVWVIIIVSTKLKGGGSMKSNHWTILFLLKKKSLLAYIFINIINIIFFQFNSSNWA